VETATRAPALAELNRAVAIAVTDPDIEVALLEAAAAERFEAVVCHDLDDVADTVRSRRAPIVVLQAAPGRSLDDLAADAGAVIAQAPEGVTVAYVSTTTPPRYEIRPEITDWLVWPASESHLRTKLRAWLFRRACRWQAAALPASEPERLVALWNLGILDTEPEARFDRLTEVACTTFDVPAALVSLVDAERQWFKSHPGLDLAESHRDMSFCAHAILDDGVFVVTDALRDDRFADNPAVAGDPRVRFYAGVPLAASGGHRVGTLCIMDHRPRLLNEPQLERLRELGRMVEAELAATIDAPPVDQ
jgi:GAF domain-containing protein